MSEDCTNDSKISDEKKRQKPYFISQVNDYKKNEEDDSDFRKLFHMDAPKLKIDKDIKSCFRGPTFSSHRLLNELNYNCSVNGSLKSEQQAK